MRIPEGIYSKDLRVPLKASVGVSVQGTFDGFC